MGRHGEGGMVTSRQELVAGLPGRAWGDPQIPEGSQTLTVHLCAHQAFGGHMCTNTAIPFQTVLLEMLGCCPGHWACEELEGCLKDTDAAL